jgi:hypothetical protein
MQEEAHGGHDVGYESCLNFCGLCLLKSNNTSEHLNWIGGSHTAVTIKRTVFWDVAPYSPVDVNRHFGGTDGLLQGRRVSHPSNQPACCLLLL